MPGGFQGPRGPRAAGTGLGRDGDMGPGMTPRRGLDPNDPDITGPRGEVGLCQERATRFAQRRIELIQRVVRPTEEQRQAFEELRMAASRAAEIMRSACPAERPLTPTGRLAAAEKSLEGRLQAIRTVRPALESFYRLLSDEQKMRWAMATGGGPRWGGGEREARPTWPPEWRRRGEERRGEEHRDWGGPRPGPDLPYGWGEPRGDWGDRFGEEHHGRGPDGEWWGYGERDWGHRGRDDGRNFGNRWGEDGHGGERWREPERNGDGRPPGREERRRSTAPDEERL